MAELHDISARDRRLRERRIWRSGIAVSAILHILLFFVWRGNVIPASPFAAAGPRAGDNRAAAGGMQAINVPTPITRPIIPPPRPIEVAVEVEPVEFDQEQSFDAASIMGDLPGLAEGPGLEDGTGEGDGGNADEGFYRLQPATPRSVFLPTPTDRVRGAEVRVWVFVDARGRVVADSTRLEPPTRDGAFNRRLIREAAEWLFHPARQEGRSIAAWFPYEVTIH